VSPRADDLCHPVLVEHRLHRRLRSVSASTTAFCAIELTFDVADFAAFCAAITVAGSSPSRSAIGHRYAFEADPQMIDSPRRRLSTPGRLCGAAS
jgi:hypothetical protein